jgi:hypothetical protein
MLDAPKQKHWKQALKLGLVTFKNPVTGKREPAIEVPGIGNPAQVAVLHECYRELQRKAVANTHLLATLNRNSKGHLTQASRDYIYCHWDGVDKAPSVDKGKSVDKKPSTQ